MAWALTPEQVAIVEAYRERHELVVEAGAGAGKTSTLRACAESDSRTACYLAYNRAIKDDAERSFPRHVTCSTAHSLAFRAVGRRYIDRLNGGRMPARTVAQQLGIWSRPPFKLELGPQQVVVLDAVKLARIALGTITQFCQSAHVEIDATHVPTVLRIDTPAHRAALAEVVVPLATRIWADVVRVDGAMPFTHDCYLKLWQLQRPRINAEVIFLDEAQDANPVIAAIVDAQTHAQRVLVGDRCQQLYAWRGAVDAMDRFEADVRLTLSQSFRFGPAIAEQANLWLELLESTLRLRGFGQIESTVGNVDQPDAILCRTNAGALAAVMLELEAGRRVALVGGDGAIRLLAEASIDLQAGRGCSHPDLAAFANWAELVEYVEQDDGGSDLRTLVRLVEERGAAALLAMCDRITADEKAAQVTVSTAHRSKGREWGKVRVGSDFRGPRGEGELPPRADLMLAYVTVTRAKNRLDRGGLAWIDDEIGGGS